MSIKTQMLEALDAQLREGPKPDAWPLRRRILEELSPRDLKDVVEFINSFPEPEPTVIEKHVTITKTVEVDNDLHMDAAMCLWEAMLELREDHASGRPVTAAVHSMSQLWDNEGTSAMRHTCRSLVALSEAVWMGLSEDEREPGALFDTYDWDFCPEFLKTLSWGDRHGPDTDVRHADAIREKMIANAKAAIAQRRAQKDAGK